MEIVIRSLQFDNCLRYETRQQIEEHKMSRNTPIFVEFKETNAGQTNVEMSVGTTEKKQRVNY